MNPLRKLKRNHKKKSASAIPLETYSDILFFKLIITSYKSLSRLIGSPLHPCCVVGRTVGGGGGGGGERGTCRID